MTYEETFKPSKLIGFIVTVDAGCTTAYLALDSLGDGMVVLDRNLAEVFDSPAAAYDAAGTVDPDYGQCEIVQLHEETRRYFVN